MKLPSPIARSQALGQGKSKMRPALGERTVRIRKVEGSIPFGSTRWTLHEHLLFQRRLRRKGVAVMSKQNQRVKVRCALALWFLYM